MTLERSAGIPAVPAAAVGRPGADIARPTAGVLVGVLVLAAVVLFGRRIAGALHEPLQTPLMLGTAATVAGVALAVRLLGRNLARDRPGSASLDRLCAWGPTAALLVIGVALSRLDASSASLIGFWGILGLEECLAWRPVLGGRFALRRRVAPDAGKVRPDASPASSPPAVLVDPSIAAAVLPDDAHDHLTQQVVRGMAADGGEILSGWVRVGLARGQRTAAVHVAFCPPFGRTPILNVKQIDGPRGRIKTVQLLPYGTRFDLKLPRGSEEPASVLLQFSARSEPLRAADRP